MPSSPSVSVCARLGRDAGARSQGTKCPRPFCPLPRASTHSVRARTAGPRQDRRSEPGHEVPAPVLPSAPRQHAQRASQDRRSEPGPQVRARARSARARSALCPAPARQGTKCPRPFCPLPRASTRSVRARTAGPRQDRRSEPGHEVPAPVPPLTPYPRTIRTSIATTRPSRSRARSAVSSGTCPRRATMCTTAADSVAERRAIR